MPYDGFGMVFRAESAARREGAYVYLSETAQTMPKNVTISIQNAKVGHSVSDMRLNSRRCRGRMEIRLDFNLAVAEDANSSAAMR